MIKIQTDHLVLSFTVHWSTNGSWNTYEADDLSNPSDLLLWPPEKPRFYIFDGFGYYDIMTYPTCELLANLFDNVVDREKEVGGGG